MAQHMRNFLSQVTIQVGRVSCACMWWGDVLLSTVSGISPVILPSATVDSKVPLEVTEAVS